MADTGAHLVDHVILDVSVRQWVLSPPHALHYRVACDSKLLAALIRIFIRAIFCFLRRRDRACGILRGQCGGFLGIAILLTAQSGYSADKWISIRSKNFLFVGNASESQI